MEIKQKNNRTSGSKRPAAKTAKSPRVAQRQKTQSVKTTPDVVYLPPKTFNRNRLILHLATVAAVVLALVLGLSVFFKVDTGKITVSGTQKYTAWDVANASGIKDGENLITFSRGRAAGQIKKALKYVKDVRIGIKLPDTVYIDIVEVSVTYAVKAEAGGWWLISSEGRVIEKADETKLEEHTKILGVQLENPKEGDMAVAFQQAQTATDADGYLIPVTTTAAQQLTTAVDITGFLERNGIIGEIASIDVNDLGNIQLWYGKQYQVELGNDSDLLIKISELKAALDQYLNTHDSGILDITDPSKVVYTSF